MNTAGHRLSDPRDSHESYAYLEVIEPGAWTTVQDCGRYGYRAMGVPVCGTMDPLAAALVNKIAGNEPGGAVLEMTFSGPVLRYHGSDPLIAAIYGANGELRLIDRGGAEIERQPQLSGSSFAWPDGAELSFGAFCGKSSGCRAYLAIAGGLSAALALGSAASDWRSGLGGHDSLGHTLQAGDRILINRRCGSGESNSCGSVSGMASGNMPLAGRRLRRQSLCEAGGRDPVQLHFLSGPEEFLFDNEALDSFYGQIFTVSQRFDRMGYALEGPAIKAARHDIISAPVTFGTVQVPASGNPYLLMADAQTTGGYPRLAVLISADRPAAAQLWPGLRVRPVRCTLPEALQRLRDLKRRFNNALWPPAEQLIAPV